MAYLPQSPYQVEWFVTRRELENDLKQYRLNPLIGSNRL